MKFKMRVIYHSRSGIAENVAIAIARDQKATADKIPPAYPIENEKLLFVLVEANGSSADKAAVNFCKDLTTGRTKNVAFLLIGGNVSAIDELKQIVSSSGINVVGDVHMCVPKGMFKKRLTDDDIVSSVAWAAKIVDAL